MEDPQFKSRLSNLNVQVISTAKDEEGKVDVNEVELKYMGRCRSEHLLMVNKNGGKVKHASI